ncbi:MAG: AAA family ATPase, partial [Spirochaetales bacterium]|nr:AAA family ATPase [Spirochaetales bacterium]
MNRTKGAAGMQRCPRCAALNPLEARFCMRCGSSLPDSTPQPAYLDGERRVVTILFADVVGSTTLAERMDPEQWTRLMNGAYEALLPPVRRHGGTVARLMGDGLLAFFGAPTAHEDDPLRALRAAQELVASARSYARKIKTDRDVEFAVRVGVNTGTVIVGSVGGEPMREYTAMGDAVNVAARLQSLAEPNSVLVAERTHELIADHVEVRDRGWFTVKGKSRKVRAFRLLAVRAPRPTDRGMGALRSPLVGRQDEQATLRACLEEAQQGRGSIVAITGEAGIGKSRLLQEFREEAGRRQALWLEGGTASAERRISYWPFRRLLRQAAGIGPEDDEPTAWERLAEAVNDLFGPGSGPAGTRSRPAGLPDPQEVLPYLGTLLALKMTDEQAERARYLDAEALRHQIFLAARRFFERIASRQVTVLAVEDLHWADESSLRLLEYLLGLVESTPLVFCLTSRVEAPETPARVLQGAARRYGQRFRELPLLPLTAAQSGVLLRNLLGAPGLPASLQQLITAKAGGNPRFMEEVLRSLVDSGGILRTSGTGEWRAARAIDSLAIPNTLQALVAARLDRLDEGVRRVLRIASVIGRSFDRRVLEAVAGNPGLPGNGGNGESLHSLLRTLEQGELIEPRGAAAGGQYLFRHALVQEITYNGILLSQRRELHASVARVMERLFPERREELAGVLAYHYARAEAWDQAH